MLREIVSQHAEEAADLWNRRDHFARDPNIRLKDLARLDERIEAHIDGLRIAGTAVRDVCEEISPGASSGEVFARFLWAFSTETDGPIDAAISISANDFDASEGLSAALGWLRFDDARPYIDKLLAAQSPLLRHAGIAASAIHRQHPGPALRKAISSSDVRLRACALRSVGELGALNELNYVLEMRDSGEPTERFWSAWSATVLSWRTRPLETLMEMVEIDTPYTAFALAVILRRLDPKQADRWIATLLQDGKHARLATLALGVQGDPTKIPLIIDLMESKALSRLAGVAFRMITGQDLKRDYLSKSGEAVARSTSIGEEREGELSDLDQDLPWPDVAKIKAESIELNASLQSGHQYLLGRDLATDSLHYVLQTGQQRERICAAVALSMREVGTPIFNCFWPARRQSQFLR